MNELQMVTPEDYANTTLEELAQQINNTHDAVGSAMRYSAMQVVQNGARLIAAKAKCGHGQWLPWLAEKCPKISDKTAQRYMNTYKRTLNSTLMSNLASMSPTEAYRALKVIPEKTITTGDVHVSEGIIEWYTPPEIIAAVRKAMGSITCDPASSEKAQEIVNADVYYTESDDGIKKAWEGNVFLNPPYKMPDVEQFVDRAIEAIKTKECKAIIVLTNNSTDTDWFQKLACVSDAMCFPDGRLSFYNTKGEILAARQGQAFFYKGPNKKRFTDIFAQYGIVLQRIL